MCALLCAMLSLMVVFLSAGYASLTDNFALRGHAKIEVPSGLFITNIERVSYSGLRTAEATFEPYSTTVTCSLRKSSNNTAGSVTFRITVFNNTDRVYAFRKLYYQTDVDGYANDKIRTTSGNRYIGVSVIFPQDENGKNKTIGIKEELTFEVIYTIGSSSSTFPSRNTYQTLINYQFGINVDSEEEAVEAVHEKFLNILNTSSTYGTLVDVLDNKYDGYNEWTSNYVGNVGNATSDDALTVNTLFAGQLELIINGETRPATVLIKHENLDNNENTGDNYTARANTGSAITRNGCEMTLYLTTHSLERADSADGYAPVYVTVFTRDKDAEGNNVGEWYKIGDIYEGRANIVGYKGEADGEGSFVTDNWVAYDRTYTVSERYSYHVPAGTTIKALAQVVDDEMIAEFGRLLTEAKAIIDDVRYAGTGIDEVEDAFWDAYRHFSLDENNNPVPDPNVTRAQLCPDVRALDAAIRTVKEKIEEATALFS